MKERPILFSADMVRAILDGRKTQTRRVVNPVGHQRKWLSYDLLGIARDVRFETDPDGRGWASFEHPKGGPLCSISCPYGVPGDRLWVRETYGLNIYLGVVYVGDSGQETVRKTVPSIFMPRWASRILLELTDVRVQRVQDISEEDASEEGIKGWDDSDGVGTTHKLSEHFRYHYRQLWDILNAKRGLGWDANPWVWALTFKVLENQATRTHADSEG